MLRPPWNRSSKGLAESKLRLELLAELELRSIDQTQTGTSSAPRACLPRISGSMDPFDARILTALQDGKPKVFTRLVDDHPRFMKAFSYALPFGAKQTYRKEIA